MHLPPIADINPRLISSFLYAELHQRSVEQTIGITLALGCRLEDALGQRGLDRRGSLLRPKKAQASSSVSLRRAIVSRSKYAGLSLMMHLACYLCLARF